MTDSASSQTAGRRVALVTGAADRIGAAIAERLAADGWQVVVHYRYSARKAEETAARIRGTGGQVALVRADLLDREQRRTVIARAAEPFGPLTLLVNNASIFERDSVADLDEGLWDAHFAIHAEAPAFLARDFAAQLAAGDEGNIISIIDERVLHTSPGHFSYSASKATLWAITRTLAQSLAPRIRVNAIGPGPTVPPPYAPAGWFEKRSKALPLARSAGPVDIAQGVVNIVAMRTMTGQMIALDGGEHIEWPARRGPTPRAKK